MNAEVPLTQWQRKATIAGAAGLCVWLAGVFFSRERAFQAWWMAWLFWGGISFGAGAMLMLQFLTPGEWGLAVRPGAQAAVMTLPLVAVLFIPALFALGAIFPWQHAGAPAMGPHHQAYLKPVWFALRGVFCLGIPLAITLPLALGSSRVRSVQNRSAFGLVAYFICMLVASTDWVMSLVPQWYSTMLPVIVMAGQFLSALALTTFVTAMLAPPNQRTPKRFHDLGNLLLAFVTFWAYVSFSQFLIIWSGNLPREIAWYLPRRSGGWLYVTIALALLQFAIPFALLLSRLAKRNEHRLAPIAALVFVASALNIYWLIGPAFHPQSALFGWLDVAAFVGIGGAWTGVFIGSLKQRWWPANGPADIAPNHA